MTSVLFSPISLANLKLSNRVVVSPMCQYSADDGCANDWHLTHLGMLANSGASIVTVEATHVARQARITHGCLGLYDDANEAALARVIAHCRHIGKARWGIQIAHAGRKASAQRPWEGGGALKADEDPWPTIAPSAIPFGDTWHTPREMTPADFDTAAQQFVTSAERAVRIGFDAVELHMAHGYLLHSIASPISNKRTDAYGPGQQGGWHYLFELAAAVRAVVPHGTPVGARITGSDWADGGLTPNDAVAFTRGLKQAGLDYVDISSGGITAATRSPTTEGYNLPIAERVKREAGIATRVVGLITHSAQAETAVRDGRTDMVALARGFLDNPHWGWQAARDLGSEVERPVQYARAAPKLWAGASARK